MTTIAKLREVGLVMTQEKPTGHSPDNTYKYAMVFEFESAKDMKTALANLNVSFLSPSFTFGLDNDPS